ncbi:MAG: metal-dependent hydrolase [Pyrinomonadaceae bacterium]
MSPLFRSESSGSMFSHRGLTHSIVFAFLFGALAAHLAKRFLQTGISYAKLFVFFSLATLSHPLLDMLTDGGSGVALFAPFSAERFFFPFRPVEVSPIGMGFFSARGFDVIISEIIWLWLPSIAVLLTATLIRKLRKSE